MNYISHADLGGQLGHGRVVPEPDGEYFHAAWQARALAVTLAAGATGAWNIDMSRAARETLPDYGSSSYYRIWIAALEKLLAERGMVHADELAALGPLHAAPAVPRVLHAADVAAVLAKGSPTERAGVGTPRFALGDAVRARLATVAHHTRLPAYVRGHLGVVERVHGMHVFADSHAQGLGEQPQWLYSVSFAATELWGPEASSADRVAIDAWQSYLEPA